METAGSVSVPLRSALNRGPPDLERPVCRSFVEARRFLILSGFAGFLFYHTLCCLWLPLVTHGYHLWLRFKGFTSLFLIRLCIIVLQCNIRRITKSWEASITLPPVLFTTFVIALRRKLWVPFYQILPNRDAESLTHPAVEIVYRVVGYYSVIRFYRKQVLTFYTVLLMAFP